jgi:hypothetical protein
MGPWYTHTHHGLTQRLTFDSKQNVVNQPGHAVCPYRQKARSVKLKPRADSLSNARANAPPRCGCCKPLSAKITVVQIWELAAYCNPNGRQLLHGNISLLDGECKLMAGVGNKAFGGKFLPRITCDLSGVLTGRAVVRGARAVGGRVSPCCDFPPVAYILPVTRAGRGCSARWRSLKRP